MDTVAIRPVTSAGLLRQFIRLPWRLYRGDPNWVPPLLRSMKTAFDRKRNPFFQHADMALFLAEQNGRPAGRIAAIFNRAYNDYTGEKILFFGYFECVNDAAVAQALFDAVRAYGRDHGMTELRGPTSPSMHGECGLLIEGFDSPPVVMMPYNPPYYTTLVEQCGLGKCKDLFAYKIRREDMAGPDSPLPRLERFEAALKERFPGLSIRSIDMSRFFAEVQTLGQVFNEAREQNWGYAPMSDAELAQMAKDLKPLAKPDMCLAAEFDGELVGAGMALPDVNVALKHINGRLFPFGAIKLLRALPKIRTMRVFGMAAKPEHRRKGVAGLVMLEILRRAYNAGYHWAEASWVNEDNVMSNRTIMALIAAERYKTYRIYSQGL